MTLLGGSWNPRQRSPHHQPVTAGQDSRRRTVTVHDYIQDADTRTTTSPVADAVWMAALPKPSQTRGACYRPRRSPAGQHRHRRKWLAPLARNGNTEAVYNRGDCSKTVTLPRPRSGMSEPRRPTARMNKLGLLLNDGDSAQEREWWQRAA
jgi:hypothetical protein